VSTRALGAPPGDYFRDIIRRQQMMMDVDAASHIVKLNHRFSSLRAFTTLLIVM